MLDLQPVAARQVRLSASQSRPSAVNSRTDVARCSSPSRKRPRRAIARSKRSCAPVTNGASCSHFSKWPQDSTSETLSTSCSSNARCQARKRRRWARSQPVNSGQRSISSPSRRSPLKRERSSRARSAAGVLTPACAARLTSSASTRVSARSSRIRSCRPATRVSPTMLRSLLSDQRSSPRGSLAVSHRSAQSRVRGAAPGVSARYASMACILRDGRGQGDGATVLQDSQRSEHPELKSPTVPSIVRQLV